MSDNLTKENPDARSFEERVFARFDAMDRRFDSMKSHFDGRLTTLETKVDALDGRLTALEDRVDERLRETRPIWEAVLARLDGIDRELRSLNRTVGALSKYHVRMQGDLDDLEDRVEKLESESTRR